MTPDEAAWVRANAWTPRMRRAPYWVPGQTSPTDNHALAAAICRCMAGVCAACRAGIHQNCDRRTVAPRPEWWIDNLPTDYIPPTAVWYADRACRSLCPCCPAGPPRPVPRFEVVPLFNLAESHAP